MVYRHRPTLLLPQGVNEQWDLKGPRGCPCPGRMEPLCGAVQGALPACPGLTVVPGCCKTRHATAHRGFARALCKTSPSRTAHGGVSHLTSLPHEAGDRATLPGHSPGPSLRSLQEKQIPPERLSSHRLESPQHLTQLVGRPDLQGSRPAAPPSRRGAGRAGR